MCHFELFQDILLYHLALAAFLLSGFGFSDSQLHCHFFGQAFFLLGLNTLYASLPQDSMRFLFVPILDGEGVGRKRRNGCLARIRHDLWLGLLHLRNTAP
jgi:hypothetical protein